MPDNTCPIKSPPIKTNTPDIHTTPYHTALHHTTPHHTTPHHTTPHHTIYPNNILYRTPHVAFHCPSYHTPLILILPLSYTFTRPITYAYHVKLSISSNAYLKIRFQHSLSLPLLPDDGVILSQVYDGVRRETFLLVLQVDIPPIIYLAPLVIR